MVVLTTETYTKVCAYIKEYKGLWMECQLSLEPQFPDINPLTLSKFPLIFEFSFFYFN